MIDIIAPISLHSSHIRSKPLPPTTHAHSRPRHDLPDDALGPRGGRGTHVGLRGRLAFQGALHSGEAVRGALVTGGSGG